jgi:hypothetical protein
MNSATGTTLRPFCTWIFICTRPNRSRGKDFKGLEVQGTPLEKNRQTGQIKKKIAPEDPCASMPAEFAQYLHYLRQLQFVN